MDIIDSLRNTVLHCPIHSVLIIAAGGNIHKHAGLEVAVGLHKDDLDGMGSADILKGVGLHRADALAVDFDVGDGVTLVRGDDKGLVYACANADIAGGRNGAASPGSCLDGAVVVIAVMAPMRLVTAVAGAAIRDGDGQVIFARQVGAAPAGEGIAAACGVLESKGIRLDGVGVRVFLCRAAVQIVGDGVLIDRPLRRQGQVLGGHGRGDFFVPTGESISFSCRVGGRGDGCAVVLRDGRDFTAAVGIKGDGVLIDRPLRRQGQVFSGHRCRERRIPAHKRVAGLGGVGGRGDGCAVVLRDGRDFAAAVGIKGDGVDVCLPHGIEGQRRIGAVTAAEGINLFAAVHGRPAYLRMTCAGEQSTSQREDIVIEFDIRYRVARAVCAGLIDHIPCVCDTHIGLAGKQGKHIRLFFIRSLI